MDMGQNIEELQKVANYRLVRKGFKGAAIGSIIFGLIAMGTGFGSAEESSLNVILGLIGIFLLAEGIWLIRTSNPKGLIIDGIALCILGIWNIVVTFASAVITGAANNVFALLGVFQIIWGVQSFRRYRHFADVPSLTPSEQTVKQVDEIIGSVSKAKAKESEDVIEFQMSRGFGWKQWRGKFTGETGVFVTTGGDDAIFARREEVDFIPKGKVLVSLPGKTLKVSVQIGKRTFNGIISPESMARYEAWKEIPAERREVRKEALAAVSSKSRLATTLLAFFLGAFGVHRFYLGKIGTGILMLITLGGLGIWAFIDFILAVSGIMKDKEGNPIKNW